MHEHKKVYLRILKCSVNNTTPLIDGTVYFYMMGPNTHTGIF